MAIAAAGLVVLLLTAIGPVIGCRSGVPSIEIASPQALLSPYIIGSGSVFMRIVNSGNGADTLISARVDIPGTLTELHDTDDGKMVKTEDIPIPPGGAARLRPGGPHIMIFKLPKDVKTGSTLPLTLLFKKSGEKKVSVIIVDVYRSNSAPIY